MQRLEKILPYLFATLLPAVNVVSNYPFEPLPEDLNFWKVFPRVIILVSVLFFVWKINEWVIFEKNPFRSFHQAYSVRTRVLAVNLTLIFFFLVIEFYILPKTVGFLIPGILALRMSLAMVLVNAVLFAFKGIRERESLVKSNLALQSQNMQAQFEILKQQVNPHFLFNSLSTLRTMVRAQDPKAEEYVLSLSELYRDILKKREVYEITLQEELAFLKNYRFLLELRHGPALQIDLQITPESMSMKLPTYALQLLLENCIKHNIVAEARPLQVRIFQTSPDLLCIENNLQPKSSSLDSEGVGLENLRKRYQFLNLPEGLRVEQDEQHFRVCLQLLPA